MSSVAETEIEFVRDFAGFRQGQRVRMPRSQALVYVRAGVCRQVRERAMVDTLHTAEKRGSD
jgi:hypothetical protein